GAGALLGRRREEALVERLDARELLELLARLEPARVVELLRRTRLVDDLLRAGPQREEVVPVSRRPRVLAAQRDRLDADALERLDGVHELVDRRRRPADASLLEEVLAVVDATRQHRRRHAVDLPV